jgi:hypothetical protein
MKRLQQILVDAGYDIGQSGPQKNGVDNLPGRKTKLATREWLQKEVEKSGLRWCHNNLYELRMSEIVTDRFSDICIVVSSNEVVSIIPWTTKPGKYWIKNPVTVGGITGTGIQKEGQTIGSHQFVAKGKSKWGGVGYFRQVKTIPIYRDSNKDNKIDRKVIQKAPSWYGFFKHAMGRGFSIWNWSAGCCGCAKIVWAVSVAPYFKDGDIISPVILDI